ncbi:hypothetical protein JYU34_005600 [Plutella xylostella]|uniref:Uncharacterized protein n=1 Tax=Plutella xylostella TaxID=51655 RepID=A0ABQ7QTN2_PLUXY|nr:hypothetical protein JYU34_005600 [Plutella xylostella]
MGEAVISSAQWIMLAGVPVDAAAAAGAPRLAATPDHLPAPGAGPCCVFPSSPGAIPWTKKKEVDDAAYSVSAARGVPRDRDHRLRQ